MWIIKTFDDLTTRELHVIYKLRVGVFVVEQSCAYPEVDDADLTCLHGMKWERSALVGYFRLIEAEDGVHLGRVIVAPNFRRTGLGRELVSYALQVARERFPEMVIHAQAQAYLENFYASFGFQPVSEVYLEDGIPHLDMLIAPS
ncbi:GNAT family N-acetyltransferase [Streptococcus merionis]|uniref:Acetyltransferase, GNAT family n=1 Tax=Streptococcus merionis TaxID=400065 RepID=A0A239SUR8_9STRE|nr:GNAT family N-acetyltransferase [Streptococcus merionis]SNU89157.1 acetyltransferase, GNAT family [Streptococcus merionis]